MKLLNFRKPKGTQFNRTLLNTSVQHPVLVTLENKIGLPRSFLKLLAAKQISKAGAAKSNSLGEAEEMKQVECENS